MAKYLGSEWLKDHCPICGKEFAYLPNYKPTTCGAFTCVQQAVQQRLIPPSVPYGAQIR